MPAFEAAVPRQNHIGLKTIDFASRRLSRWTPCSRCLVPLWFARTKSAVTYFLVGAFLCSISSEDET
jgi:hypothetical protein